MRLACIGTFHGRLDLTGPLLTRVLEEQTRPPDELWVMCEDMDDWKAAHPYIKGRKNVKGAVLPTPREGKRYTVIPYSHKINWALHRSRADAFVYLDNGSMPHPEKFRIMAEALEEHPTWGAVYCAQKRTGFVDQVMPADQPVGDGYCALNYTQVMHRRTYHRWPLDMRHADPDMADGVFWRSLHKTLGDFHPVGGDLVLDTHHIPSPKAAGIE